MKNGHSQAASRSMAKICKLPPERDQHMQHETLRPPGSADLWEIFAGKATCSKLASENQLNALQPIDLIYGQDLKDNKTRQFVKRALRKHRPYRWSAHTTTCSTAIATSVIDSKNGKNFKMSKNHCWILQRTLHWSNIVRADFSFLKIHSDLRCGTNPKSRSSDNFQEFGTLLSTLVPMEQQTRPASPFRNLSGSSATCQAWMRHFNVDYPHMRKPFAYQWKEGTLEHLRSILRNYAEPS